MTTRRGYAIALTAASLALLGSMGAATAYAVSSSSAPASQPAATGSDWNDGPGWMMDPDSMMGGNWTAPADFTVTADQARAKAQAWIATREPGATLGDAVAVPMGYRFIVTLNGTDVGVVMVNGTTGTVAGHGLTTGQSDWTDNWHGMMGQNWNTGATFTVTDAQAAAKAKDWLATREPGATLGKAVRTPMGYRFTVALNGKTIGVVMVNGVTGRVAGHAVTGNASGQNYWADNWHGMMGQNSTGNPNSTSNSQNGWNGMMDGWSSNSNGSGWGGMMR
jgi:hypothetical protein